MEQTQCSHPNRPAEKQHQAKANRHGQRDGCHRDLKRTTQKDQFEVHVGDGLQPLRRPLRGRVSCREFFEKIYNYAAYFSFEYGTPIAAGATARPTKPASSSTVST